MIPGREFNAAWRVNWRAGGPGLAIVSAREGQGFSASQAAISWA